MAPRQLPKELIQAIVLAGPTKQLSNSDLIRLSRRDWIKHLQSYTLPLLYTGPVAYEAALQLLYSDVIFVSSIESSSKFLEAVQSHNKASLVKRLVLEMPVKRPEYRYEHPERCLQAQRWQDSVGKILVSCPNLETLVSRGGAAEIATFPSDITFSGLRFLSLDREDFSVMIPLLSKASSLEHLHWLVLGGYSETVMFTDPNNISMDVLERTPPPTFRLKSLEAGTVDLNLEQTKWLLQSSVSSLTRLSVSPFDITEEYTGLSVPFFEYLDANMPSLHQKITPKLPSSRKSRFKSYLKRKFRK